MSARVAELAARRRRHPAVEPVLTDAQALAAEVLEVEASLSVAADFVERVEVNAEAWTRIVELARKVGGS